MQGIVNEGGNMRTKLRFALFGLLLGAGFALAPVAFARGHVNIGVNIGLPGFSLGYSDCRGCYGGYSGYGGYYGGGYANYYAPAPVYYAPSPVYYGPSYYGGVYNSYPVYRSSYYNGSVRRGHYNEGRHEYRGRHDRDNGRRASYYDRDGYRH